MLNSMTVGELIEHLKRFDPSKPVVFGSCAERFDSVTECFLRDHSVVLLKQKEVHINKPSPVG